jgi:hypothetical protein
MKIKHLLAGGIAAFALTATATASVAQQKFISIGTGGVTGVYYPTGGAICRLVNKDRKEHGIRCSAESTGGSIYNINTVRAGELEFGVAQSDWQYHSYNGTSEFKDAGPYTDLRAVFSIHPEPVTVIARADANVGNITDLKGKRLNIGNPGSGTRGTWEVIENALGWTRDDLKLAGEMKSAETGQALCDDKIDAYFWLVGHPSALTQESLATCESNLVNVTGPEIAKLVADNSFYRDAIIPAGMYGNNPEVKTFGVAATLVSSTAVPDDVVYVLVKAVFDNFDQFKALHPSFANLTEAEMITEGLSAPLHDGAIRYYKERGWM